MTPTPELVTRLRKHLNEMIPEGGTDSDTRFLDDELNDLLTDAASIFGAASVGWMIKAGMLQGDVEKYSAGTESYTLSSLKDQLAHAKAMSEMYGGMGSDGGAVGGLSLMIRITEPEVL